MSEVQQAVIGAFGRDWLFVAIRTGGWQEEMSTGGYHYSYLGERAPRPTGNTLLEIENGSTIVLNPRHRGVRIYVTPHWAKGWTRPGQMRFNPRPSTIQYALDAMSSDVVVEDFDLLLY